MTKTLDFLWCATDRAIVVWNMEKRVSTKSIHPEGCSTCALSTETGGKIWTNSLKTNNIYVYDSVGSKAECLEPPTKDFSATVIEVIERQVWVLSGTQIFVWDLLTEKFLVQLPEKHTRRIRAITSAGDNVWTGGEDSQICIWSMDFNFLKQIDAHNGKIKKLRSSPYNDQVWSACSDGSVRVWNNETFELIYEINDLFGDVVSDIVFARNTPKGIWTVWISSYCGTICVFELRSEKSLEKLEDNRPRPWSRALLKSLRSQV